MSKAAFDIAIGGNRRDLLEGADNILKCLNRRFKIKISTKFCQHGFEAEAVKLYGTLLLCSSQQSNWDEFMAFTNKLGIEYLYRHIYTYHSMDDLYPLCRRLYKPYIDIVAIHELTEGFKYGENYTTYYRNPMIFDSIINQATSIAEKRHGKIVNITGKPLASCSKIWEESFVNASIKHSRVNFESLNMNGFVKMLATYPSMLDVIVVESPKLAAVNAALNMIEPYAMGPFACGRGDELLTFGSYSIFDDDFVKEGEKNPIGLSLAIALMLEKRFNLMKEAAHLRAAVSLSIEQGYRTGDIFTKGKIKTNTQGMIESICENLKIPIRERKKKDDSQTD